MSEENVRVAVRVRPFNSREQERNAMLIVDMQGNATALSNPEAPHDEPKKFTFDFSYWSFDGCQKQDNGYMVPDPAHVNGAKYCDQRQVFKDLGNGVMENAWKGFNCSLFAYGQTGSGKSYSVVGYGVNKGIVPMFCEDLFNKINEQNGKGDTQYEVSFSMLEIYNENVRDLLNPGGSKKSGLPVRQHPKMGFYAEGLKEVVVNSYIMIEKKMEEGTANRTIAATNMNATSSRAHTIVSIKFVQKYKNPAGKETAKTSIINLVDLAGSERADSTGATGDRLKEGAAINLSLSSLGNVIAALADNSQGKGTRVPYRDSVLTKLLMNALGGNSRTIMVAAISPADINFEETLSTLRYADRAKQIKCKAVVNEDPTEKLITDLKAENERLKKMLESGDISKKGAALTQNPDDDDDDDDDNDAKAGLSDAEREAIRAKLEAEMQAAVKENERQMEEMKRQYEEKLKQAQDETHTTRSLLSETNEKAKKTPHLYNLNIDPLLTGQVKYLLQGNGIKKIGKKKDDKTPDIGLLGPGIYDDHAAISMEGGKFFIEKLTADARVLLNGAPVMKKTEMSHNDRLVIATISYFVFCIPSKASGADPEITFDMAQQEIAKSSGITLDGTNKSKDELLLQQDLIEVMADIEEANSISEELDKKMKFELVLVSPEARGLHTGRTEAFIRVTNFESNLEWLWDKMTFISRKEKMEEIYDDIHEGEKTAWLTPLNDPFYESPDAAVLVGTAAVYLKSVAYLLPFKEQLQIVDYKGENIGYIAVELVPCNAAGKPFDKQDSVDVNIPSKELSGKDLQFLVKIANIRGLPRRFEDIHCQYKVYMEDEYTKTEKIMGTNNPDFNHSQLFSYKPCTMQQVDYFLNKPILIQIWGEQKHPPTTSTKGMNTRELIASERQAKGQVSTVNSNTKVVDPEKIKLQNSLDLITKRMHRLETRVEYFKDLVDTAEKNDVPWVSFGVLKKLSKANSEDDLIECIKKMNKEKQKAIPKSSVCTIL